MALKGLRLSWRLLKCAGTFDCAGASGTGHFRRRKLQTSSELNFPVSWCCSWNSRASLRVASLELFNRGLVEHHRLRHSAATSDVPFIDLARALIQADVRVEARTDELMVSFWLHALPGHKHSVPTSSV